MAFMSSDSAPASRVGLDTNDTSAGVDSLFLKVFSGEILTAFETATVMKSLHTIRTLSSGKSATFPVTGIADSSYHTVGESIVENGTSYLSDIGKTEKQIFIDDMLISSTFLANVDELKNHYDIRSIYAAELGKALAKRFDIATMKTLWAATGTSANLTNAGGTRLSGSDLTTTSDIIDALFAIATQLDENDAPSEGRFAIVTPKTYYQLLTSDNNAINNVAVSSEYGNGGNVATGSIPMVAGIRLVKSNHLKDIADLGDQSSSTSGDGSSAVKNDVTGSGSGSGYESDFSTLKDDNSTSSDATDDTYGILAGTKEAIGTVKLLDLATESEYQIERQGTLFVAKYMMGHGVLRPECAVAFKVS